VLRKISSGVMHGRRWLRERWSELKKWKKKAPESEKVGFLVWCVMGVFIAVPELWAVGKDCEFPYPTISTTVGHLQDRWPVVALIPVALIVMPGYFVFYLPPSKPPYLTRRHIHFRTREGRRAKVEFTSYEQLEALPTSESASKNPLVLAKRARIRWRRYFLTAIIVCGGSWGIIVLSQREGIPIQSENRYVTGYVLYALIAVFWVIVPSVAASLFKKDVSFTTLAYTIGILGRRIPILAALTAALLMILLLHLALYPWPSPDHPLEACTYSP
jgi:uncharacterized membrane protein YiaA